VGERRRLVTECGGWLIAMVCLPARYAASRCTDSARLAVRLRSSSRNLHAGQPPSYLLRRWRLCLRCSLLHFREVFFSYSCFAFYDVQAISAHGRNPSSALDCAFRLVWLGLWRETMARAGVAYGTADFTSPPRRGVVMTSTFDSSHGMCTTHVLSLLINSFLWCLTYIWGRPSA